MREHEKKNFDFDLFSNNSIIRFQKRVLCAYVYDVISFEK